MSNMRRRKTSSKGRKSSTSSTARKEVKRKSRAITTNKDKGYRRTKRGKLT